jgi:hypothetical protein
MNDDWLRHQVSQNLLAFVAKVPLIGNLQQSKNPLFQNEFLFCILTVLETKKEKCTCVIGYSKKGIK